MYLKYLKKYGPAKEWPHDLDIFEGESKAFMHHLSARGCHQRLGRGTRAPMVQGSTSIKKWGGNQERPSCRFLQQRPRQVSRRLNRLFSFNGTNVRRKTLDVEL